MHRLIMTSAVYQQSSEFRQGCGGGRSRQPPAVGLPAAPAGRRSDPRFQPAGVRPAESEGGRTERLPGTARRNGARRAAAGSSPRRTSAIAAACTFSCRRNTRYPMLEAFDMPDTHESCSRRDVTTTAPQALTMLNDKVALEWAQAFAGRALAATDPVDRAFRLAYSRPPDAWEKDTVATFFHKQKSVIAERAARGEKLALPTCDVPDERGTGVRRGIRRFLPDAAELQRIRLSELSHEIRTLHPARNRREFLMRSCGGLGALAVSRCCRAPTGRIRWRPRSPTIRPRRNP